MVWSMYCMVYEYGNIQYHDMKYHRVILAVISVVFRWSCALCWKSLFDHTYIFLFAYLIFSSLVGVLLISHAEKVIQSQQRSFAYANIESIYISESISVLF